MINLYNLISFIGWILVIYLNLTLNTKLIIIQIVQTIAIFDVILAYFKLIKTNYVNSFIQILSRYFVVWGPFTFGFVPKIVIGILTTIWGFADSIRYLYYLNSNNYYIKWLRYNMFLILYPLGIIFELISLYYSFFRKYLLIIAIIYLKFGINLYMHMLKQRQKKN